VHVDGGVSSEDAGWRRGARGECKRGLDTSRAVGPTQGRFGGADRTLIRRRCARADTEEAREVQRGREFAATRVRGRWVRRRCGCEMGGHCSDVGRGRGRDGTRRDGGGDAERRRVRGVVAGREGRGNEKAVVGGGEAEAGHNGSRCSKVETGRDGA
jgi:hypothetical protein